MEKTCIQCNLKKTKSEFNKNKNCNDGYMETCKSCRKNNRRKNTYEVNVLEKKCSKCEIIKNKIFFYKNKYNIDGLQSQCKECHKIKHKKYLENNGIDTYFIILYKDLVNNAKKRKIDIEISKKDIINLYNIQNGLCSITNIKMTYDKSEKKYTRLYNIHNISVDRINSKKAYTIDNIQLVCVIVNIMKTDLDFNNFIELCNKVSEKYIDK